MKMWMFNCKEISHLVSDSMDEKLPTGKRMGVRFHLMMCTYCRRMRHQLQQLRAASRKSNEENLPPLTMATETKDRLQQRIKTYLDQNR